MSRNGSSRSGELLSGGVPVMVPDPCAVAPGHVQARVIAERLVKLRGQRDALGRPLKVVTRTANGSYISGFNRITLPRVQALDCMSIKEEADKQAERV